MKTLAIASIVGSVILYVYLALAHTVLPIHNSDYKYTTAEDSILKTLKSANLKKGLYFLPYMPPDASNEEKMTRMKEMMGKPGALVNYYPAMEENTSTYIMSFIYNLISVLILCIALATARDKLINFRQRLWFVMLFVLFVIFSEIMLEYNWVGLPMHYLKGEIIDQVIGYLLTGIWLAWYYGRLSDRKKNTSSYTNVPQ
ncbi:MAG: hypothetical protein H0W62_08125 [Chitinophagales bacterium]|nr:hypothetical protein [Chitinophagales bacterium]